VFDESILTPLPSCKPPNSQQVIPSPPPPFPLHSDDDMLSIDLDNMGEMIAPEPQVPAANVDPNQQHNEEIDEFASNDAEDAVSNIE
jgi:hypothetical protein